MKDKYSNKSAPMRFIHRYTGFIVFGGFLIAVFFIWDYYEKQLYFFESYACEDIFAIARYPERHETLTEDEHLRLHEIIEECMQQGKFPTFEH